MAQLPKAGMQRRAERLYEHLDVLQGCAAKRAKICWSKATSIRQ